jgi:hypothetical protein
MPKVTKLFLLQWTLKIIIFQITHSSLYFNSLTCRAQAVNKDKEFVEKLGASSPLFRISFLKWSKKEKISFSFLDTILPPSSRFLYHSQILDYWFKDVNGDSLPDYTLYLTLIPKKRARLPRAILITFLQTQLENKKEKGWPSSEIYSATEIMDNAIRVTEAGKLLGGGILMAELQYRSLRCFECIEKKMSIRLKFSADRNGWLVE